MEGKIFKIESVKKLIDSKEAEDIEECILKVELHVNPIGEGNNANIYIPEDESLRSVCIKKGKEKQMMIFNSIDDECEFQKVCKNSGIRTPLTLLSFSSNEKEDYLVMERINGNSVKEILKNTNLMPEKFNYQTFCNSLNEQIDRIHRIGIYHRDLHPGNIMIDEEGLPVIIDFGTAVKGSGSDNTYEDTVQMYNHKKGNYEYINNIFSDDLIMIKNIRSELKAFTKTTLDIQS